MASYHCQKEGMLERRSLARACLHFAPCKQPNVRLKMNRPCLVLFGHHGNVESLCLSFVYADEIKCANCICKYQAILQNSKISIIYILCICVNKIQIYVLFFTDTDKKFDAAF